MIGKRASDFGLPVLPLPAIVVHDGGPRAEAQRALEALLGVLLAHAIRASGSIVWRDLCVFRCVVSETCAAISSMVEMGGWNRS